MMIPALYVFMASEGREAQAEAHELLRQRHHAWIPGSGYVTSVVEGVLQREAPRR